MTKSELRIRFLMWLYEVVGISEDEYDRLTPARQRDLRTEYNRECGNINDKTTLV